MPSAAERPLDPTLLHTAELPATPQRDRTIPATAWVEAPGELRRLGADLGHELVSYKRRIGRWLLWGTGPARHGHGRYMALSAADLSDRWTYRVYPDGTGEGVGPDGVTHTRFRSWKEALRDT